MQVFRLHPTARHHLFAIFTLSLTHACVGASGASDAYSAADAADDLRFHDAPRYSDFIWGSEAVLTSLYDSPHPLYASPLREKWNYRRFASPGGSYVEADAELFAVTGRFIANLWGDTEAAQAIASTTTFRRRLLSGESIESVSRTEAQALTALTRVPGRALYSQAFWREGDLYLAIFMRHRRTLLSQRREFGLIFAATRNRGQTRLIGEQTSRAGAVPLAYRIEAGRVLPLDGNELVDIGDPGQTTEDVADVGSSDPGLPDENDA